MREARKKSCAVFAKFCLESKECGDGVFCFLKEKIENTIFNE